MAASHGMLDPGNVQVAAPYYIAGKSGALTLPAAGNPVATLQNLGRLQEGVILPVSLRISQVRLKFSFTSGALSTVALEVYKGTVTTQHNAGGSSKIPTPRKTSFYPSIAATEVNLFMASTGAISGGAFVVDGDPFLVAAGGFAAAFGVADAVWAPSDLVPITLDAGQGLEVRVAQQGTAAVGVLWVAFDFLRQ